MASLLVGIFQMNAFIWSSVVGLHLFVSYLLFSSQLVDMLNTNTQRNSYTLASTQYACTYYERLRADFFYETVICYIVKQEPLWHNKLPQLAVSVAQIANFNCHSCRSHKLQNNGHSCRNGRTNHSDWHSDSQRAALVTKLITVTVGERTMLVTRVM
jgi:hypothetical protein